MKQLPGFWDYPEIWGAIAALAFGVILLFGYFVHGKPFEPMDAIATSGVYFMGWAFGVGRYYAVFRPPED